MRLLQNKRTLWLALSLVAVGAGGLWGCSSDTKNDADSTPNDAVADGAGDVAQDLTDLNRTDETVPDATQDLAPDLGTDVPADLGHDLDDVSVDGQDTVEVVDWPEIPTTAGVAFEVQTQAPLTPFPWNFFLVEDPAMFTGRRLEINDAGMTPGLLSPLFKSFPGYDKDLDIMDGFGSYATIVLPVNTAMDPASLPAETSAGGPIDVVTFDAQGVPRSVPYVITYEEFNTKQGALAFRLLTLAPVYPLKERTTTLVLVKKALTDAVGAPFAASPAAEVLLGLREPFGTQATKQRLGALRDETLDLISKVDGLTVDELATAFTLTTGMQESPMFQAAEILEAETPEYNLDPDDDGQPNLMASVEYYTGNNPDIALVVTGTFKVPDFRDDTKRILPDAQGNVAVHSYRWAEFYLLLPKNPAATPVPFAIMQHGINSWKETMFDMDEPLLARGIAVAGFDFVHHAKGADGGFKFLPIDRIGQAADNFRQSALDIITFRNTMERLFADMDFVGVDQSPIPDADFSKVVFTGHSLGAIESTIAAALYAGTKAAGLPNPGANLNYLLEGKLKDIGLYDLMPGDAMVGMKITASQLMSNMDPAVFAPYLQTSPWPGHEPVPFLLILSTKDATIYPSCGHALTRALDSPFLDPIVEPWANVPVVSAEGRTFGTVQFDASHEAITGSGDPTVTATMRNLLNTFIYSYLVDGTPLIDWPPNT